ncbi:high choriolytic enzyme 1-like [Centropristis striata]|uniref:high choriolytic enzyme 1-like n=1 Tax=Centropristis striata TaxID=184440 RepID=UPI0027DFB707|nr:high choriolytic enzyme 1-like [Centropristis striata]
MNKMSYSFIHSFITINRLSAIGSRARGLIHDDILPNYKRNAVPCTARGCKWPKDGRYVKIPITISSRYTGAERNFIIRSLVTFYRSTCIRFYWRQSWQSSYIHFFSGKGCYSSLGRQGGQQMISLKSNGCLFTGTVQHEVLHALGFHHEQVRSDRDKYIQILTKNIRQGKEHNFVKVATNNLDTPYDFQSVMHYSKFAFSRNGSPTIVSKTGGDFGRATEMSANDIARINRLYQCRR